MPSPRTPILIRPGTRVRDLRNGRVGVLHGYKVDRGVTRARVLSDGQWLCPGLHQVVVFHRRRGEGAQ